MSNLRFFLWDLKHLGKAKKAMPLPSDLPLYLLSNEISKRKTLPDHECIQQFVVKKLLPYKQPKSWKIYFLWFSLQMAYIIPMLVA